MRKNILITGATGNIGENLCRYLASKGHDLILTARNKDKLVKLASQLEKNYNIKIIIETSDFEDPKSFISLIQKTENCVDGLVLMPPQPPETTNCLPEDNVWEKMFKTSFIGPTALIRELIPTLKNRKGAVVLISGISSKQALSNYATSNVLRTAWIGEMKTLANYYGPNGIRFNTLSLGGVMTEKFKENIRNESKESSNEESEILSSRFFNVPLRRYAEIGEIGSMLEMLMICDSSKHLTGQNIAFDGGFTQPY